MPLITDLLGRSCSRHRAKTALRCKVAGRWLDYTYDAVWTGSDQIAAGLLGWGMKPGERAALLAPSSPAWVLAYLGIIKGNGIAVPIDKDLKRGELRHILSDCGARLIFTEQPYLETILDIADSLPELEKIVLLNPPPVARGQISPKAQSALAALISEWQRLSNAYEISETDSGNLEKLAEGFQELVLPVPASTKGEKKEGLFARLRQNRGKNMPRLAIETTDDFKKPGPPPAPLRNAHDPVVILYTSGTTGRSKGAVLSHANITSNIQSALEAFNLTEEMSTLSFLPINHVFEQVGGILLPLSVGGTVSFAESLRKLGENLAEVKPNFLLGVPAVFRLLADRMTKKIEDQPLSRVLFNFTPTKGFVTKKIREAFGGNPIFISGGAALDPIVATTLMDFGLIVYQGYGITETSPIISLETARCKRLGTVGRPLPGVEVKIHQANDEGVGEIWVKGPNVMLGYYNNPVATREVLTDGWYHTGDLGKLDADGMLSICGRVKNLIVTANGKNVYPEEIENELLNSPFIAEIMVYGHKIDKSAEEVYAIIYPDNEALDAYAKELGKGHLDLQHVEEIIRREVLERGKNLADYKRVRRFTLREDEFPKTTTRKIKRFAVEADIDTGN